MVKVEVVHERPNDKRGWSIWTTPKGDDDGRLVAAMMTEEDARRVARLLNEEGK